MNNEEKVLKIHVSKPFETILGVGLQEHCPWTPLGVGCAYNMPPKIPPFPPGCITDYVHGLRKTHYIRTAVQIQILY